VGSADYSTLLLLRIVFLLCDFERALWCFLTEERAGVDAGLRMRSEIAETLRRLLQMSDAATIPRGGVNGLHESRRRPGRRDRK